MGTGSTNFDISVALQDFNTAFQARLSELFESGFPGTWARFTRRIDLGGARRMKLGAAGPSAVVEEFQGAKVFEPIRMYNFVEEISMKTANHEVEGLDFRYDNEGILNERLNSLMRSTASMIDLIVHRKLVSNSGEGPIGYDGVNLIDTAHPHGPSGSQGNKTTSALSFATFETGVVTMESLQLENGEPAGRSPTTLVVGPKNKRLGMEITGSNERVIGINASGDESGTRVAAAAAANVFGGGAYDLVVDSRLVGTQDDYAYLVDESDPDLLPMAYLVGRDPEVVAMDEKNSYARFYHDVYQWSIETDSQATANAWQSIYGFIL